MNHLHFFLCLLFFSIASIAQNENSILLKTDFEGNIESGSIENLISEIQKGSKIRVGWKIDLNKDGSADLEHWIDANFLSILNGHVFNQIEPIYKQLPKSNIPQVEIIESTMMWTGIIGTNGKLISRYIIPELLQIEDDNLYDAMAKQTAIKEKMVATVWAVDF